ncbi:MAG: PhzF family phenazine biosynthesis protein [Candidatus Bathyarchaeota archaeon]|nr:MAG: PhzF family phenazine biosynthesis protein [Candidatus Bathyarchaeota archaeon]
MPFHIVDVFAEDRFKGNQLAVFRDRQGISDELMQSITREMNFSESTFIRGVDLEKMLFKVRIFTPAREVPFAGHPTLGTAYVIQRDIVREPVDEVILDLKAGKIPVRISYEDGEPSILWMKQLNPVFGDTYEPEEVASLLNLEPGDIDPDHPVQEVSTSIPFFIVPLRSGTALKKAKADKDRLLSFIEKRDAKAPLLFCPEPRNPENHLEVRMFGAYYGIEEDPATGSGNGCLAGYLARHRYFGSPRVDIRVEQGHEVGRPSLLYLRSEDRGEEVEIHVGGKVVMIAKGEFV